MISEKTFQLPFNSGIQRLIAMVKVMEKEPVLLWMPYQILID